MSGGFGEWPVRWGALAGGAAGLAVLLGLGGGRLGPDAALASEANLFCQQAYNTNPASIVSKNGCGITRCGVNNRGFCVQTIGHIPRCLFGFNPEAGKRQCPRTDQCDRHGRCPNGTFCAKVEGCCGRGHNTCLRAVS